MAFPMGPGGVISRLEHGYIVHLLNAAGSEIKKRNTVSVLRWHLVMYFGPSHEMPGCGKYQQCCESIPNVLLPQQIHILQESVPPWLSDSKILMKKLRDRGVGGGGLQGISIGFRVPSLVFRVDLHGWRLLTGPLFLRAC